MVYMVITHGILCGVKSMEIRLYHNVVKRVNSTKQPSGDVYETRQCRLKEETSIMSPTFLLSDYSPQYNYIYVPKWGRYYFINNVTLNIDGVFEASCTFDALASYKNSIGAITTFIERTSDGRYIDPYLRDNAISCADRFVSSESATTDGLPGGSLYILRVLGRGGTNGVGTFVLTQSQLNGLFSAVWGNVDNGTVTDYLQSLSQLYINDPAQYIIGVYRTPIGIITYNDYGSEETLYIGGHETDIRAIRINSSDALLFGGRVLNKPVNAYTDFRATDPAFSQYTLYIPTIGTVSIPPEIMNMELKITCCADLLTGDLTFMLYADDDIVATYTSNCYASVSVGVQNGSSGASILSSALTVAGAIQSGAVALALPTVINGAQKVISPPASMLGTQGSIGAVHSYPDFILTLLQKSSSDAPTPVYGKPCCKNLLIGNMTGYIKCQGANISNIAGTDQDKEIINSHLNNGFYYE